MDLHKAIAGPPPTSFPPRTDYARIAVLQTEREHIRRELTRLGDHSRTGRTPMADRYDAIDRQIKEGLKND